jgi:membrane associated rhomboid family serine protease
MAVLPAWVPFEQVVAVAAFLTALGVVLRADGGRFVTILRNRLLLGVPWGTVTVCAAVLAVYLFVQGGVDHWYRPVTIPFRAWSYFYPLGLITSSFTHTGPGHLIGNLVGTLAYGSLAEYALGHYPTERGSSSFGSPWANPYVRAFVVVPVAVVGIGLVTTLFSIGPVIGFSGVVFAFAGYAVVSYPLATVLVSVATRVMNLLYRALTSPQPVFESRPVFSTPWFAEIALQTHALGFLVGVLLAVWVSTRQSDGADLPSLPRVWTGVLLFAVSSSFWAVYWFRDGGRFVLFRWAGVALVSAMAVLVAVAVAGSDRPLVADRATTGTVAAARSVRAALRAAGLRHLAVLVIILSTAGLGAPATVTNLATADDSALPGETIEVRDYEVTYVEDVPNGMVAVIDVEAFGETTRVNTSGVVVRSTDRGIWLTAVQKGQLALTGRSAVRVGGVGWRETVVANRTGYNVVGNDTVYRVALEDGDRRVVAYTSPARRAEPVIRGRNVSVRADDDGFELAVEYRDSTLSAPMPGVNESVVVQGIRFTRQETKVFAMGGETRVRVATLETYRE